MASIRTTSNILRNCTLRRTCTPSSATAQRAFSRSIAAPGLLTRSHGLAAHASQLPRPSFAHFRRQLTTDQRAEIQKAVDAHPVVLFMKGTVDAPQCGFSRAVVQILDLQQVPPEKLKTFNVLDSTELREGVKEFSEWPTIPQLYVDGEFVGGCDIVLSMHQAGELETLLETKGVIPKVEATAAQ